MANNFLDTGPTILSSDFHKYELFDKKRYLAACIDISTDDKFYSLLGM